MNLTDIREIQALLERHKFRFSKSMGQNFLTASWVPEDIAASAMLDEKTGVVEVGPGIGCLTNELSKLAGRVLSVELDKSLKPILTETLADCDNVEIVFSDVLKLKLRETVEEKMPGMEKYVVCANLPYNVTSPLLTAFIEAGCFEHITVMIQREVAKRICAAPNTADYGAFGIFVQWYMDTELLFDVTPDCFIPQPKVTSSVIRLTRRREHPAQVKDEKLMFQIIRAAFNQRRKTLVNAIGSQVGGISKEMAAQAIEECGFDTRIRGEAISLVGFAKISDKLTDIKATDL